MEVVLLVPQTQIYTKVHAFHLFPSQQLTTVKLHVSMDVPNATKVIDWTTMDHANLSQLLDVSNTIQMENV